MKEYRGIKRVALLMLAASVVAGCAPQGSLGTVGAILTAPITAPVMFVSARMNGRDAFLESARRNDRPLPAVDARSKTKAGETLEQALERGMVDQGLYWQNNADASGYPSTLTAQYVLMSAHVVTKLGLFYLNPQRAIASAIASIPSRIRVDVFLDPTPTYRRNEQTSSRELKSMFGGVRGLDRADMRPAVSPCHAPSDLMLRLSPGSDCEVPVLPHPR